MMSSRLKARLGRALIISLLAVPSVSLATGLSASAAGTSAESNGCYVQWWSTAWEAKCAPAGATGNYMAHVSLADQTDYNGSWRRVSKGASATFDSGSAWRGVQASGNYVAYKG